MVISAIMTRMLQSESLKADDFSAPFSPLEMKLLMQQNCIESCRIILKAPSEKLHHEILQRYSTDDGDSRGDETYYRD